MSNITLQEEGWEEVFLELAPIVYQHWLEVEDHKEEIPLEPDWLRYRELASGGFLTVITVRDDSALVGYSLILTMPSLHSKSVKLGVNDVVYLKPLYRKTGLGTSLFKKVEEVMKEKGVKLLSVSTKTKQPFDDLCIRLGYENTERLYTKYIGD